MKTLNVAVIFGGRSQEHESSVASGAKIIETLRKNKKYNVIPVGVTREGKWYTGAKIIEYLQSGESGVVKNLDPVLLAHDGSRELIIFDKKGKTIAKRQKIDVAFAWILGPNGEDGTLQGFFEIANIPYVGCGVFASAVGFNKVLTKTVLNAAGVPQVPYVSVTQKEWKKNPKEIEKKIWAEVTLPCFVKPASCGSSIGVSKVKEKKQLTAAINEAFKYDNLLLVEGGVPNVHEIECSVLGDEDGLTVSIPGEVHYEGEFYDYKAKYLSTYWEVDTPPKIPKEKIEEIRELAAKTFRAIQGSGGARIDFLVNGDTWEIYLNELNTIPNFRPISCYPTLLQKSGLSYAHIIDTLIKVALKRDKERQMKDFSFKSGTDWFKG